jgi:hypothetical protein
MVDWRTYTTAPRWRWSGVIFEFVDIPLKQLQPCHPAKASVAEDGRSDASVMNDVGQVTEKCSFALVL